MIQIESVVDLGKIIFIPIKKITPPLPEMSLLFLKEEERGDVFPWRAACIDLEIDACGDSMNGAWENLKHSLTMYIEMEKNAAGGSIIEAAKNITQVACSDSEQKREYFALYRKAKMNYFIHNIETAPGSVPIVKKQQHVKLEVEQEPISSSFGELNESALKTVSAIYLFSEQEETSPKQPSIRKSGNILFPNFSDGQFWHPLVSPPQGRITFSHLLEEGSEFEGEKNGISSIQEVLEN